MKKLKEQYEVQVSNRFADLENLHDNIDIVRAWERIRISKLQLESRLI